MSKRFTTTNARAIPLLTIAQLTYYLTNTPVTCHRLGIDSTLAKVISDQTFALTIQDESMSPALQPADLVLIDPAILPQPGEIVAATMTNPEEILIRKFCPVDLEINPTTFRLIAYNNDWPDYEVDAHNPGQIIGTLVEHRCKRRLRCPANNNYFKNVMYG
jgi:SOS-response transcriptional repressor LexA